MSVDVEPQHDPACWGCGDNPTGSAFRPRSRKGRPRQAYFRFDERHQGGPGLVHGGLVGSALDEACGLLATWYRFPTVTARIFVRYRLPVAINTELLVRARIDSAHGRRIRASAELTDGDERLAEARGAFLHVPLEHFLSTLEGQAARERLLRNSTEVDAG